MRRSLCILLCIVLALACLPTSFAKATQVDAAPLLRAKNARSGMVRVYLSSMGSLSKMNVTIAGSYTTSGNHELTLTNGETVGIAFNTSNGQITMTRGGVSYNMGTEMAFRRHAASGSNGLKIMQSKMPNNLYPGDLYLKAQQVGSTWKLYPIVHVYIEYYLHGVVPYEMGNSAPIEALKAQAVAARTYTLNKMNIRAASLYDVVDTTNDQVYYGNSDTTANCTTAVDATRGIVLMNGDSLTSTYYTASNGGQTESAKNKWNSSGLDYLTVKDDPFDLMNASSMLRKVTVYANNSSSSQDSTLKSLLTEKAKEAFRSKGWSTTNTQVTRINDITPHTPMYASPSRLYTKLDFDVTAQSSGGTANFTLTFDIFSELEKPLGMSINSVQNELWSVSRVGDNFQLESRRFGHGVGMSQRGAMQMGSLGYTYDQILGFYYENSKRVQYTFTHTILSDIASGGKDTITNTEDPADITTGAENQAAVKLVGVQDRLAVRAAADTNAPILTSVVNGGLVTVLAKGDHWTLVRLGQIVGYAPTSALVFSGTPPTTSTETPTNITQWATVSCNGKLNLRSSASLSAKVISSIPDGAVLCVFSIQDGWANVQYGAQAGWASMDFLKLSDTYPGQVAADITMTARVEIPSGSGTVNLREAASTSARVLKTIAHGSEVTLVTNDGSWCFVQAGGTEGYIMTKYLDIGLSTEENTPEDNAPSLGEGEVEAIVKTVSTSLNMRAQPTTASAVLMSLPRGESIVVTSRGSQWSAVRYGSVNGYVMTMYLSFPADSENLQPTGYATVNTQSGPLNMRSQPTTGSSIVQQIPKGAQVGLIEKADKWYRVTYNNKTGYVMASYLAMQGETSQQPSTSTGAYATVTTSSGGLNLRETPSSDARVLLSIPKGTVLSILSHENGWCRVSYGGKTGYVMDRYLTFRDTPPENTAPPAVDTDSAVVATGGGGLNLRELASSDARVLLSIPNGAQVELLRQGSEWCQVRYNGSQGYVMTKYLKIGAVGENSVQTAVRYVSTASGGLNIREIASSDARVMGAAPRGYAVTLLQDGTEWCKIQYNDLIGWVMSKYLSNTPPADVQENAGSDSVWEAVISPNEGNLNLRSEPSMDALVITAIPKDEVATLLTWGDAWCKIRYKELEGYCMTQYLTLRRTD